MRQAVLTDTEAERLGHSLAPPPPQPPPAYHPLSTRSHMALPVTGNAQRLRTASSVASIPYPVSSPLTAPFNTKRLSRAERHVSTLYMRL